MENLLNQIPVYFNNQQFGIILGFIKDPTAPQTHDVAILDPKASCEFTGVVVAFKMHLPKPAKYIYILADRNDVHSQVYVAWVNGTKFSDHHTLHTKPTTWTCTPLPGRRSHH
ncbi:MAG: hypothetical protein LBD30_01075 [Verrucomicrobiales bacterium]|nr:hypothetical protein [Verrucomicrobiales bacterium]